MADKDCMLSKIGLIALEEQDEWDFMDREATVLPYNNPSVYNGEDSDSGEIVEEK
jgi:hypothetical protein